MDYICLIIIFVCSVFDTSQHQVAFGTSAMDGVMGPVELVEANTNRCDRSPYFHSRILRTYNEVQPQEERIHI